jgi:hypothetical protein
LTNTGIPYEILTKQIFDGILRLDGVRTIDVKHNVTLPGKSRGSDGEPMKHQIDVYWEFELGDVLYKTAIQAKDWRGNVPQGEVLKFKAVLDDLPGQPRGIMVARTGFQEGAKSYASSHGIELYELREPNADDLTGRFVRLILDIQLYTPSMEIIAVEADTDWVRATAPDAKGSAAFSQDAKQAMLYAEDARPLRSLYDVLDSYVPKEHRELPSTEIRHVFDSPTFIDTNVEELPRLKILAVNAKIAIAMARHRQEFDFSDMLTYIISTVSGNKTYFVDSEGHVRRA